jgi:hypothetical protein
VGWPGSAWFCVVLTGFPWLSLVQIDFACFSLVSHCFVWFNLVLLGFAWFCLVLPGFARFFGRWALFCNDFPYPNPVFADENNSILPKNSSM